MGVINSWDNTRKPFPLFEGGRGWCIVVGDEDVYCLGDERCEDNNCM